MRAVAACAALLGAVAACNDPAGIEVGALTLNDAPPSAPMRAGYVTVINHGAQPRTLVSASSADFGIVEFHRTQTQDGVARMREVPRITIAPGERVVFEPFGLHLMLMQPRARREDAAPIEVELCFGDGECVIARAD